MKITENDYSFVDRETELGDHWVVKLTTGKYADTYYKYGAIKITEAPDESEATLTFDYGIVESAIDEKKLVDSEEFNEYIGKVLTHIIESSLEAKDYKMGDKDESGNDDIEESDQ